MQEPETIEERIKRIVAGGGLPSRPSEVPTTPSPAPEEGPTPTWDSTDDEILAFAQRTGAAPPTDVAAQRQVVGEERVAEAGRLWRDLPSNLLEIASNIGMDRLPQEQALLPGN